MINYGKQSRLSVTKILDRAARFFGADGMGLSVTTQNEDTIKLEGGGGFVYLTATRAAKARKTSVDLISREWEEPAKQFLIGI